MEICCTDQHCVFVIIYRNSDYYIEKIANSKYIEKVLEDVIPQATGNTMSYGSFSSTQAWNRINAFYAFDKIVTTDSTWAADGRNNGAYLKFLGNFKFKIYAIKAILSSTYDARYRMTGFDLLLTDNNTDFSLKQTFAKESSDYKASDKYKDFLECLFVVKDPIECTGFNFVNLVSGFNTDPALGYFDTRTNEIIIYGKLVQ